MSIESRKIDGENIYMGDDGFLHDELAECQTVADCIRSMSDERLAEYMVKVVHGTVKSVCEMAGVRFIEEAYSEETAMKSFLEYLHRDISKM